jgi:hypothetical protein
MSTFHTTTPGNASNSATWTEHAVPGPTDEWIIQNNTNLDSGLASQELDDGGTIEVQSGTLVLNADVTFTINAGAALTTDGGLNTFNLLGTLLITGGTFSNLGVFESTDNSSAALVAYGDALLVNPTTFFLGRWMGQSMEDGTGGPTTVRLQYTAWSPPGSATYFAPAQVLATVAHGATLDFITRDGSGAIADPDYFPTVPVMQTGAVTDTVVTLRRNSGGSYTATFSTPDADQSYYVPVNWTIGGNTYVQEFRVTVLNPDLPGKVLGGGDSTMLAAGVITANPATQVSLTTETTTIRS